MVMDDMDPISVVVLKKQNVLGMQSLYIYIYLI